MTAEQVKRAIDYAIQTIDGMQVCAAEALSRAFEALRAA